MKSNRFFRTIVCLSSGKESYDAQYRQRLHWNKVKKNHEKLFFLQQRISYLFNELKIMTETITDQQRLKAIKEEIDFLKGKIYLLKH